MDINFTLTALFILFLLIFNPTIIIALCAFIVFYSFIDFINKSKY